MNTKHTIKKWTIFHLSLLTAVSMNAMTIHADDTDTQDTIDMPITLYDHQNDGLLFEYALGDTNASKLDLFDGTPVAQLKGLSAEGTPVYTEETLAYATQAIVDYFKSETIDEQITVNNVQKGSLETIFNQTVIRGEAKHLVQNNVNNNQLYTLEDKGWSNTDGFKFSGDHIITSNADKVLSYTYNNVEAGTYYLFAYDKVKNIKVTVNGTEITKNGSFTLSEAGKVTLTFQKADSSIEGEASIIAPAITTEADNRETSIPANLMENSNDSNTNKGNIAQIANNNIAKPVSVTTLALENKSTIAVNENTQWAVGNYDWTAQLGGFNIDANASTDDVLTFTLLNLKPNTEYVLTMVNEALRVNVSAENADVQNNNHSTTVTFKTGNETTFPIQFRNTLGVEGYRNVFNLQLREVNNVRVGSLAESVAKYGDYGNYTADTSDDNITTATSSDISTVYDYVYYTMNNFFRDNQDNSFATDDLNKLTLSKDEETGLYVIDSNAGVNYDTNTKSIYQDTTLDSNNGFFPVDTQNAKKFYDNNLYNHGEKSLHNFHFAMSANTAFTWAKGEVLEFKFFGDDDTYLFINDELTLDLGGAHEALNGQIEIDADGNVLVATTFDEEGNPNYVDTGKDVYDAEVDKKENTLKFFYMERHTTASGLRIQTNFKKLSATSTTSVTVTDQDGNSIENESSVFVGDTVNFSYTITSEKNDMSKIALDDTYFAFSYNQDTNTGSMTLKNGAFISNFISFKKNGKVIASIHKNDLNNQNKINEVLKSVYGTEFDDTDSLTIDGISKTIQQDETIDLHPTSSLIVKLPEYNDTTGHIEYNDNTITSDDSFKIYPQVRPIEYYDVTYTFVSEDDTPLPEEIIALLPSNQEDIEQGTLIHVENPNDIEVDDGTWTFVNWDKDNVTLENDTTFTGTWKFVPTQKPSTPDTKNQNKTSAKVEKKTVTPNTSDSSNIYFNGGLLAIALLACASALYYKKEN